MAAREDRNALEERGPHPQLLVGLLVAALGVTFVAQNRNTVTIHFLVFSREMKVWVALLITAVLSIVAAEMLGFVVRRQSKH